jgi:hypothetical protein
MDLLTNFKLIMTIRSDAVQTPVRFLADHVTAATKKTIIYVISGTQIAPILIGHRKARQVIPVRSRILWDFCYLHSAPVAFWLLEGQF